MATTLSLLPFTQLRQFNDDGLLLSGGKLYFYKSGTNAPLATYKDAAGTIANTNPVILNSSGSADIFLQSELYRLVITDSNDAQIYEIDGIGSGGSSASLGGDGSIALVLTYSDVRNLDKSYDSLIVMGRDTVGDGGQGLFVGIPTDIRSDDDGIILVGGDNTRYIRVLNGFVDASWYGVKYSVTLDQSTSLLKAMNAVKYGTWFTLPLVISGHCYLTTSLTVPSTVKVVITGIVSGPGTSPPTITFSDFAVLQDCSKGGLSIPFKLGLGCTNGRNFNGNWLGGGDSTELSRISSMSDYNYTVTLGKKYSINFDIDIPDNISIDVVDGGYFYINGGCNINIPSFVYKGKSKVLEYVNPSYCLSLNLGDYAYPEWFGAVGDGIVDDSKFFNVGLKSGKLRLSDKKNYIISNPISLTNDFDLVGSLPSAFSVSNPMLGSDLPTPKITFMTSGSPMLLDTVNSSTTLSAISAVTSATSAHGLEFNNEQHSSIVYFDSNYYITTTPGYLYRLDYNGSKYSAVRMTTTKRYWEQLFVKNGVMYGVTGSRWRFQVESGTVKTKTYSFTGASSTATSGSVTETMVFEDVANFTQSKIIDPGTVTGFSSTALWKINFSSLGNRYTVNYLDTSDWTSHTIASGITVLSGDMVGIGWLNNSIYTISAVGSESSSLIKFTPTGYGTPSVSASTTNMMSLPVGCRDLTSHNGYLFALRDNAEIIKIDTSALTYTTASTNFGNKYARSITSTNNLLGVIASSVFQGLETRTVILNSTGAINLDSVVLDGSKNAVGFTTFSNPTSSTYAKNSAISRIMSLASITDSVDSIVDDLWCIFDYNIEGSSIRLNNSMISDPYNTNYKKRNNSGTVICGLYLYDLTANKLLKLDSNKRVATADSVTIDSMTATSSLTTSALSATIVSTSAINFGVKTYSGNTYVVSANDPQVILLTNSAETNTHVILNTDEAANSPAGPKFIVNATTHTNPQSFNLTVNGGSPVTVSTSVKVVVAIPVNGAWYIGSI